MPTRTTVTTNYRVALNQIATSNKRALGQKIRRYIEPIIDEKRKETERDFEKHPVTKEIDQGPNASPISGVTGGYGNLYSFIGFQSSDNPTGAIKNILSEKIRFFIRSIDGRGVFKVTMIIPSMEQIFEASPMPWASGASWAEGIEKGIDNIGSYLYSSNAGSSSRSGTGIQIKAERGGSFNTTPYISLLIKQLKNNLTRL